MEGMETYEHPETHATIRRSGNMDFICMHYTFLLKSSLNDTGRPEVESSFRAGKISVEKTFNQRPLGNFAAMLDRIATRMT